MALSPSRDHLAWPFFSLQHTRWAERVVEFAVGVRSDHKDVDASCRAIVRQLGSAGLLAPCVVQPGADATSIDSRSLCLAREFLAWHDGLADFAFAMQGLGTGAISLAGSEAMRMHDEGPSLSLRKSNFRTASSLPRL